MFVRDLSLFILSLGFLCLFAFLLPSAYIIFEKSSQFFIGIYLTYYLSNYLRRLFFHKKLPANKKAVFITGCDSGFGYDLTKRLDLLGYRIFAGCFNSKGGGALSLIDSCSSNVTVVPLDVTSEKSVREAKEFVAEHLNGYLLWAVVNNAGVPQAGEIDWTSTEDIKAVCEVNTFGTVRVTKNFLSLLKVSKGRVINNTSSVGRFICPGFVGYCMSKSAAIAFTEGLRTEMLKWGIQVISIEPFFYKTSLTSKETAIELAINTWNKADPELRSDYGESYLESFKLGCHRTTQLSSSKIYQVINCFEDAITAEEPESVYFPAYLPHKLGIILFRFLPSSARENYQRFFLESGAKPEALNK